MADELGFLTISADTTSWADLVPDAVSTGYQAQNTNIEARNLGQDDTSISISGTNITLDSAGVIDDDGLPIVINSAVTLPVGSDGDWYIKVIAGSTSTQRSLTLQAGGGTWDTSKQGYYDTGDRVLNWKITRASGALKLYKRTKPNEGLELNGDIIAPQADITTVNATDINATDINATDINATGVVTGGSFDSGNGATELYDMNQDLKTTDDPTFNNLTVNTLNSGHGANELYPMNQGVRTTDDVTFDSVSVTTEINPTASPNETTYTLTTDGQTQLIPKGFYRVELTLISSADQIWLEHLINGTWYTVKTISSAGSDNVEGMQASSGSDLRLRFAGTTDQASGVFRKY